MKQAVIALLLLISTAVFGCGSGHELATAPVRGHVTLDGEPVASGYVTMVPSRGRMARGAIQADGSFTMGTYSKRDGVQLGTHPVTVSPVPSDEGMRGRASVEIPKKYSIASRSGLQIEVSKGGVDDFAIELSSQ